MFLSDNKIMHNFSST